MYYLYILRMSDSRLYVGITDNLQRRQAQHDDGDIATRTTRIFGAGHIFYHEEFPSLVKALKRERQVKKWSRTKKKALIQGDLVKLRKSAKRKKTQTQPDLI